MFPALMMLTVFIGLGAPAAVVGIPWSLLRGNIRLMYRWAMSIMRLGLRAGGIRVRVSGEENIPSQPVIFMSNHSSNLDPPVLLPVIPGMTSVFLKKVLMKIPLLGTAMRMGKYVPVERARSQDDAKRSMELANEALQAGLHITMFPEGTRSKDGSLLPFKKGGFYLAEHSGAPIVPVVITGTRTMMRKGSLKLYPGEAVVRFLQPIWAKDYASRDDLMAAVRAAMESALVTA